MEYHRAGFDVVGVDIKPQPNYPFKCYEADALAMETDVFNGCWHEGSHKSSLRGMLPHCLGRFDAIHASPPCQAYSVLRRANPGVEYPDLVAPTRELLEASGLPWVIENVPGAPTRHCTVLCGSMFGLGANGRQLRRHRNFETSFAVLSPGCAHEGEAIGVYGGSATGRYTFANGIRTKAGRRGGYQGTIEERREAMGIDWMNGWEINQAIPPVYTEHIGSYLLREVESRKAVAV